MSLKDSLPDFLGSSSSSSLSPLSWGPLEEESCPTQLGEFPLPFSPSWLVDSLKPSLLVGVEPQEPFPSV